MSERKPQMFQTEKEGSAEKCSLSLWTNLVLKELNPIEQIVISMAKEFYFLHENEVKNEKNSVILH